MFVGDYSRFVARASLEKVAGAWQGACFPFLGRNETPGYVSGDKLKAGATRAVFAPDGSLYLGATAGWGAGEDGLQRVRWDGPRRPRGSRHKTTARGFRLTFTRPLSAATIANPASYELNRFRYYYHVKYGSPGSTRRASRFEVQPAADGRSAELVLGELRPGFIYELSVPTLRTPEGEPIANPLGYYTVNRLPTASAPSAARRACPGPTRPRSAPRKPSPTSRHPPR